MKVNFFSAPYLLNVGDLVSVSSIDRPQLHIVARMRVKEKKRAIVIVGWNKK